MEIKTIWRLFLIFSSVFVIAIFLTSPPVNAQCYVPCQSQPVIRCVTKCYVPCPRPRPRVIRECYVSPYACEGGQGRGEMAEYEWVDP